MLKKLFGFDSAKTTVKTEIIAGITTFLTMSYILAVNPSMFSELSMPGGAVFTSTALGDITSGSALLAFIGIIITGFLYVKNVPGAILLGIIITMIIGIPMGVTQFQGVFSHPESIKPIFMQFQFDKIWSLDMLSVVFPSFSLICSIQ